MLEISHPLLLTGLRAPTNSFKRNHNLKSKRLQGAGIACWLKCQTCERKVASSKPGGSSRRIFFSRVNFVNRLLFSVCSIPVLLHWHIKDPSNSAKSADGRLHLNTHTPLTQWSRSGPTMPLCRHSVGPVRKHVHKQFIRETPSQSSQLAKQMWTDPGLKTGISACKLIYTLKKKKAQAGNELLNILPKSSQARKKPPPP